MLNNELLAVDIKCIKNETSIIIFLPKWKKQGLQKQKNLHKTDSGFVTKEMEEDTVKRKRF